MKIIIVAILIISALFAGCISSEKNTTVNKNVILDIEPSNIKVKNGEVKQIKIRVSNSGDSNIYAVVRFNINSSDRPYLNFTPESYNSGILRPGEDSGRRNVDIRAYLPAGSNITYPVIVEAVDNNKGVVIDSKDLTISVERN
jgi:uncharacterized protein YcfL